ncbi:lysine N(6)-hydroxylase/L-ornithine N(5)-oxygenase family protein [Cupriavidus plantarum]|uniref:lysine N(6)-hydroxylase/L-ornithine N(5)-oxygenase family protein n=1 Tax=Cupriavidus plantarum TaxID=942865 RepID=UPI0017A06E62|nr:lysine N(6)-hydroxylase/L-ornithine N(5)-oxygenase family protein [Cupriavidus plantarum]NYI02651.1 L-ornithine N5-oxygenase [Cupriavidus plantarum]
MNNRAMEYDILGIGFGPSNVALAIAMEEHAASHGTRAQFAFIERKPSFVWHGGMLLEDADMQISFMKDLVTLRNPRSAYSFISYLHAKGRLESFINLKTFFPSRLEFNDYLSWVAGHFEDRCYYGEEVVEILPDRGTGTDDAVRRLLVRSRDAEGRLHERFARNLVIGVGGEPLVPEAFEGQRDARIVHSSRYLEHLAANPGLQPRRIAVIGGGQSAAEVYMDLIQRFGDASVSLIMRGGALKPSDDSPFVNEIFNPGFTDYIYWQPDERRRRMLDEFRNTNYSVVDVDLIERIYHMLYLQRVRGHARHALLASRDIERVTPSVDGIECLLRDREEGGAERHVYDLVIVATGYRRDAYQRMLAPLGTLLPEDGFGVDRRYRLRTCESCEARIFLQGACEDSHGLSDTLLSVLSIRSQEIVEALHDRMLPALDAVPHARQAMAEAVPMSQ